MAMTLPGSPGGSSPNRIASGRGLQLGAVLGSSPQRVQTSVASVMRRFLLSLGSFIG
jgi:hypothetical protein